MFLIKSSNTNIVLLYFPLITNLKLMYYTLYSTLFLPLCCKFLNANFKLFIFYSKNQRS